MEREAANVISSQLGPERLALKKKRDVAAVAADAKTNEPSNSVLNFMEWRDVALHRRSPSPHVFFTALLVPRCGALALEAHRHRVPARLLCAIQTATQPLESVRDNDPVRLDRAHRHVYASCLLRVLSPARRFPDASASFHPQTLPASLARCQACWCYVQCPALPAASAPSALSSGYHPQPLQPATATTATTTTCPARPQFVCDCYALRHRAG